MSDKLTRKQVLAFSRALKRRGLKLPAAGRCAVLRAWGSEVAEVCHAIEAGKHVYRVDRKIPSNRWDRRAVQSAARRRKAERLSESFELHHGTPSWHQQRAGHGSAAVTSGFRSWADAEAARRRYRAQHPGQTAYIVRRVLTPKG